MIFLAAMVLAVELGSGFSSASAVVQPDPGGEFVVEMRVTVTAGEGPVVAHVVLPGEDEAVYPMVEGPSGQWRVQVIDRRANWTVVFEDVGRAMVSNAVSLVDLGVEFGQSSTVPTSGAVSDSKTAPWGLLALAGVALAGSLVLWLFAPRRSAPRHLRSRRHQRSRRRS